MCSGKSDCSNHRVSNNQLGKEMTNSCFARFGGFGRSILALARCISIKKPSDRFPLVPNLLSPLVGVIPCRSRSIWRDAFRRLDWSRDSLYASGEGWSSWWSGRRRGGGVEGRDEGVQIVVEDVGESCFAVRC